MEKKNNEIMEKKSNFPALGLPPIKNNSKAIRGS